MNQPRTRFWQSQTLQLTLTYLAIIMSMSVAYSGVLYVVSTQQLVDQFSDQVYVDEQGEFGPTPRVGRYIELRLKLGKEYFLTNLILLNTGMLVLGGALSYLLARRTLAPIEENSRAQTDFVSAASHELRTPLTSLRLTNEVAMRDKKLTLTQAKDVIASNHEEAIRLERLSELLLGLLTADELTQQKHPSKLGEIIDTAVRVTASQVKDKKLTVHDTIDHDLQVNVVPDAIVQAVVALIDNAIKYSPSKTTITLASKTDKKDAVISVTDEGQGIARDDIDHIFERFYRSDEARTRTEQTGYGLGLSIARQIVEAHGGRITVKSDGKNGSTFYIRLPLV